MRENEYDPKLEAAKDELTLAVNAYREATDLTMPVNKASAWYRVINARDDVIEAARLSGAKENALTQFSDEDQRDLLALMRFVRYDKHTLLKALTFLREKVGTGSVSTQRSEPAELGAKRNNALTPLDTTP